MGFVLLSSSLEVMVSWMGYEINFECFLTISCRDGVQYHDREWSWQYREWWWKYHWRQTPKWIVRHRCVLKWLERAQLQGRVKTVRIEKRNQYVFKKTYPGAQTTGVVVWALCFVLVSSAFLSPLFLPAPSPFSLSVVVAVCFRCRGIL